MIHNIWSYGVHPADKSRPNTIEEIKQRVRLSTREADVWGAS